MTQSTLFSFFRPIIPESLNKSSPPSITLPASKPAASSPQGDFENTTQDSPTASAAASANIVPHVDPYPTPNPSLTIVPVTRTSIPQLKRLTGTLLPIKYPDSFYDETWEIQWNRLLCRMVVTTHHGSTEQKSVGWIRCRLEAFPTSKTPEMISPALIPKATTKDTQIYIQALCLLAPYRGYGAAASLLEAILTDKVLLKNWNVQGLYAHVWEDNEEGLAWYRKRGFKQTILVDGYYRKLKPSGAWVVWMPLDLD